MNIRKLFYLLLLCNASIFALVTNLITKDTIVLYVLPSLIIYLISACNGVYLSVWWKRSPKSLTKIKVWGYSLLIIILSLLVSNFIYFLLNNGFVNYPFYPTCLFVLIDIVGAVISATLFYWGSILLFK